MKFYLMTMRYRNLKTFLIIFCFLLHMLCPVSSAYALSAPSVRETDMHVFPDHITYTPPLYFYEQKKDAVFEAIFDLIDHPDDMQKRQVILQMLRTAYDPRIVAESIFEFALYINVVYQYYKTDVIEQMRANAEADGTELPGVVKSAFDGMSIPEKYEFEFFKRFSPETAIVNQEALDKFYREILRYQRGIIQLASQPGMGGVFTEFLLICEQEQFKRDMLRENSLEAHLVSSLSMILDFEGRAQWREKIYHLCKDVKIGYGKTAYFLFRHAIVENANGYSINADQVSLMDKLVGELERTKNEYDRAVLLNLIINVFVNFEIPGNSSQRIIPRYLKDMGLSSKTGERLIAILERLMVSSVNPFIIRTAFNIYSLIKDIPQTERDALFFRICDSALEEVKNPKQKAWMMLNIFGYYYDKSYNVKFIRSVHKMLGKGRSESTIKRTLAEEIVTPYTKAFMDVFTGIAFSNAGVHEKIQQQNLRSLGISQ